MRNRFEGKVIAIAGGCGTIGTGISHRLAEEGGIVIIGDINLRAAEQIAAEIAARGGHAMPLRLDIADEASIKSFVETAVQAHGGLDGFHANAVDTSRGATNGKDGDVLSVNMSDFDHMMHVNMRGYFLCTRYALPQLFARGGGCMLYTSSGAAHGALPDMPVYAMAKNSIHALMRHVASRYGKQGVRSNVIAPGRTMTAAMKTILESIDPAGLERSYSLIKLKRAGEPADIAAMAALLLSDEGSYVTGQVISVDGGATMRP